MFLISPEHELLKVSYCDRSSVRTYVRLNISFETTWPNSMKLHRKLPWVSLQKYNKGSWLINNNNNNNKMADFLFYFKKHLWNYQSKFNETLQEASLGDPLQKYNTGSRLINNNSNKMADFLFCFKNISELLFQIQGNFTGTCLGWPSTKIQQGVTIDQQQQNGQLPVFSKTTSPNSMKLYRELPCVTFYKNTTRGRDWSTTTTICQLPVLL